MSGYIDLADENSLKRQNKKDEYGVILLLEILYLTESETPDTGLENLNYF